MCSGRQSGVKSPGCGWWDSNPHGLAPRILRESCVYQLRHTRTASAVDVNGNRDAARQAAVPLAGTSVVTLRCSCATQLTRRGSKQRLAIALFTAVVSSAQAQVANRAVYLDSVGVVRWRDNRQEVTL